MSAFFRDRECGEFSGNILEPLSLLYPAVPAGKILALPPLDARWRLMIRTLRNGRVGHFFWTEPQVVERLREVFEEIYRGSPRDKRYPGIYNEGYTDGLPMVCLGLADENRITVWLEGSS